MPLTPQKCRQCGAPILWLPNNTTGKKAPVDAEPVKFGGTLVVEENGAGGHHYRKLKKGEPTLPGTRHRMHFQTCKPPTGGAA